MLLEIWHGKEIKEYWKTWNYTADDSIFYIKSVICFFFKTLQFQLECTL